MTSLSKRDFLAGISALAAFTPPAMARAAEDGFAVPADLQKRMYDSAMAIALKKVRGGDYDPAFPKPFLDAAFNSNIFYWDTCFIATYAKYHQDTLPIANALDNFYRFQDDDGFICREYTKDGKAFWPKAHPVGTNPPLLAFAELELFAKSGDHDRLKAVYPNLKRHFDWLVAQFAMPDGLFISDGLGSGMDNIPRFPDGWKDDGQGIACVQPYPENFRYDWLSSHWNRQGRSVDMTAQMAHFALNLKVMAELIGKTDDMAALDDFHVETAKALNDLCWHEEDGFYYDLGYGKSIRRKHIGMFWVLIAGVVPADRLERVLGHLTDPNQFWRRFPIASFPADQAGFNPAGEYWLGSVWAPTNYMIIRGLLRVGRPDLADKLARQYYWCVAQVFEATGTFWENYAPDSLARGSQSQGDFCGWTALVPIALWHEFIQTA